MNGIITRMTNGTVGTRLARTTPQNVPAELRLVEHRRQRNAVGDRRHQQRQQEQQHHQLLAGEIAPRQRIGRRHADAAPRAAPPRSTTWNGDDQDVAELELVPGRRIPARRAAGRQPGAEPARAERADARPCAIIAQQVEDEEADHQPRSAVAQSFVEPMACRGSSLSPCRRRPGRDRTALRSAQDRDDDDQLHERP